MPLRIGVLIALAMLLLISCAVCSGDAAPADSTATAPASVTPPVPSPSPASTAPPALTPTPAGAKSFMLFGTISIYADKLFIVGKNGELSHVLAKGAVEMKLPLESTISNHQIPLTFDAASLEIMTVPAAKGTAPGTNDHQMVIQNAVLTTCDHPVGHRHFEMHARTFTLYADKSYVARHVSLVVAGHCILSIPRLAGSLNPGGTQQSGPTFAVGRSTLDGEYLKFGLKNSLMPGTNLVLDGRVGTEQLFRGDLTVNHSITTADGVERGVLSLVVSHHEDVLNRLVSTTELPDPRLNDLTISRLPALQLTLTPISFFSRDAKKAFQLAMGAGAGRYSEFPTGVTANRAQFWGVLSSPRYPLGPVEGFARFGLRQAYYPGEAQTASILQLGIETPPKSDVYGCMAFLHRRAEGESPFLFDQVAIPDELYTEVEFPFGRKSPLRFDLFNREDLKYGVSRDYGVTAILKLGLPLLRFLLRFGDAQRESWRDSERPRHFPQGNRGDCL